LAELETLQVDGMCNGNYRVKWLGPVFAYSTGVKPRSDIGDGQESSESC